MSKEPNKETREQIDNFRDFLNRGGIRKRAEELLGKLSAAYLGNIAWDNRVEIQKRLDDINNSGIDWNRDVVKSVRNNYKHLTSLEVINHHMNRICDSFKKQKQAGGFIKICNNERIKRIYKKNYT